MGKIELGHMGVIIQARAMSDRLPQKIFLPLGKKTVLEQVVRRLDHFIARGRIVVATSIDEADDRTVLLCEEIGVSVMRGSQDDVLDRYYHIAKNKQFDPIIRIGADSPLLDPDLIAQMVSIYSSGEWDYVSNTLVDSYPEGLNAEIFSFHVLEQAWMQAKLPSEREHVTPYMKNGNFRKYSVESPISYKNKRWTLDYEQDYHLIKAIYEILEDQTPYFTMDDVLSLLAKHPEWEEYNRHIPRNEGYERSLSLEKGSHE